MLAIIVEIMRDKIQRIWIAPLRVQAGSISSICAADSLELVNLLLSAAFSFAPPVPKSVAQGDASAHGKADMQLQLARFLGLEYRTLPSCADRQWLAVMLGATAARHHPRSAPPEIAV